MPFKKLGLCDGLVRGILETGYQAPTEIQSQAIPAALEGKDIIGCAQTGTGKTAAFVLPILNRLDAQAQAGTIKKGIKALIIAPTRELAAQIDESIKEYGRFLHFRSVVVFGGVPIVKQICALNSGKTDIVVATPGRLIDHMGRNTVNLRRVEVLVIDEADRMFDMGFIDDIRRIISAVPKDRQTMLFSATMPKAVKDLAAGAQRNPKWIEVGKWQNPIETVTQHVYMVDKGAKVELLLHVIAKEQMDSVLVFSRTKHGADKITHQLERAGLRAKAIHSNRSQSQRQAALDGFKRGQFQVLVATDIAARGIDVEGISHVINFDVPGFPEDYIHRIGRTGRASAKGDALMFVSPDEELYLRRIEKFISRRFDRRTYPSFAPARKTNEERPKESHYRADGHHHSRQHPNQPARPNAPLSGPGGPHRSSSGRGRRRRRW